MASWLAPLGQIVKLATTQLRSRDTEEDKAKGHPLSSRGWGAVFPQTLCQTQMVSAYQILYENFQFVGNARCKVCCCIIVLKYISLSLLMFKSHAIWPIILYACYFMWYVFVQCFLSNFLILNWGSTFALLVYRQFSPQIFTVIQPSNKQTNTYGSLSTTEILAKLI